MSAACTTISLAHIKRDVLPPPPPPPLVNRVAWEGGKVIVANKAAATLAFLQRRRDSGLTLSPTQAALLASLSPDLAGMAAELTVARPLAAHPVRASVMRRKTAGKGKPSSPAAPVHPAKPLSLADKLSMPLEKLHERRAK